MDNFSRLVDKLPSRVFAALDPLQHKTVSDLDWLCQHELDMDEEGEDPLPARSRRAIVRYRQMLKEWFTCPECGHTLKRDAKCSCGSCRACASYLS